MEHNWRRASKVCHSNTDSKTWSDELQLDHMDQNMLDWVLRFHYRSCKHFTAADNHYTVACTFHVNCSLSTMLLWETASCFMLVDNMLIPSSAHSLDPIRMLCDSLCCKLLRCDVILMHKLMYASVSEHCGLHRCNTICSMWHQGGVPCSETTCKPVHMNNDATKREHKYTGKNMLLESHDCMQKRY